MTAREMIVNENYSKDGRESGYGEAGGRSEPAKQSPEIARLLSEQERILQGMEDVISELHERLRPIISDSDQPNNTNVETEVEVCKSLVGRRIDSTNCKLGLFGREIRSLIDLLGI
jgi:hypothetical protein